MSRSQATWCLNRGGRIMPPLPSYLPEWLGPLPSHPWELLVDHMSLVLLHCKSVILYMQLSEHAEILVCFWLETKFFLNIFQWKIKLLTFININVSYTTFLSFFFQVLVLMILLYWPRSGPSDWGNSRYIRDCRHQRIRIWLGTLPFWQIRIQ